ncbi:MAG TPA: helix-turn-helix domain-containing protein [Acidimicrobiia bacterium]|nr:helix-turn-helix domain-containing protein [Acidimicrobiia bacterium]HEX2154981.1 helix-turn-helix domain-containing protein [Acidimicrobiia bacterium]
MTEASEMQEAVTAVGGDDPADGLRAVLVLRRLVEAVEAEHVIRARRAGWTWEEVGDALGVSRQAVHKKYRKLT